MTQSPPPPPRRTSPISRSATPRRWCIPPAILRDPGDTLEGDGILAESAGELGLLLWSTVRDVTLWAGTPPGFRGNLFGPEGARARLALIAAAEVPDKASASLDTLHGMLTLGRGGDAGLVSICCLELAAWARGAGLPRTAVAFAQAGALASPAFAEAALHVGVHARAAGQGARAETWLRRALTVGRREPDRAACCAALVELGELYEARGKPRRAERLYERACRAGRRCGARCARMRAFHGRLRLALRRGDAASAERFALGAQSACEPGVAGNRLLVDLARFWTDRGQPAHARRALRRLLAVKKALPPAQLLAVRALAARVRAEAGSRRKGAFDTRAAWALMNDAEIPDPVRCAAAVDLAHAARSSGNLQAFKRARQAVLRFTTQAHFPAVARQLAQFWPLSRAEQTPRAS